jgi:cell division protein FtsA
MENEKIIVGLDIGTTKVCVLVGTQNQQDKLEILGIGQALSDGVIGGVISNLDKTVSAIKKAVKQAEENSGIDIKVVNVGIAGSHIQSSVHHGSITRETVEEEITVADIDKLTNDMYRTLIPPGSKIIHVMPQNYMVDYEGGIKDPVGMAGVKLEADFHIITAQTSVITNIYKCIKRANLVAENLILETLASSLAVLSEEEKEAGVCLLDIGGGTVDIAIFHDSIIRHTAVIPFGGYSITTDIKEGLKVMESQAELLKTRFGKVLADEETLQEVVTIPGLKNRPPKEVSIHNLASIIEARMEEIIELIHEEIIASGFHNKLGAGVVITGGGAQLRSVKQLFEYITKLDTRIGYPSEYLSKTKLEEVKSPRHSTAIGLVLAGFKPLDYREARYQVAKINARNALKQKNQKEKQGLDFLKKIINKTKGLLIDDYNGKIEQ